MPDSVDFVFAVPKEDRRDWLRTLAPDYTAEIIREAPSKERNSLLDALDPWPRAAVSAPLAYMEDEAGGLMSPRFARLRPEMTIDEAIAYRRQAGQVETIYDAYVLDADQHLLGVVRLGDLLASACAKNVYQVMRTESEHQQAVAKLMADHRMLAIPVVDSNGSMQGIVTVDDAMHAAQADADQQLQNAGGVAALESGYLEKAFCKVFRKRAGWLLVLFLGEMDSHRYWIL